MQLRVLSFQTRDVRTVCEEDTQAKQRLGSAAAEALRHRLEDLRAAVVISDVLVGGLRLDPTSIDGAVQLLDLDDGWVLRFQANHAKLPRTEDGMIDWTRVNRIKIIDITRLNCNPADRLDV